MKKNMIKVLLMAVLAATSSGASASDIDGHVEVRLSEPVFSAPTIGARWIASPGGKWLVISHSLGAIGFRPIDDRTGHVAVFRQTISGDWWAVDPVAYQVED